MGQSLNDPKIYEQIAQQAPTSSLKNEFLSIAKSNLHQKEDLLIGIIEKFKLKDEIQELRKRIDRLESQERETLGGTHYASS